MKNLFISAAAAIVLVSMTGLVCADSTTTSATTATTVTDVTAVPAPVTVMQLKAELASLIGQLLILLNQQLTQLEAGQAVTTTTTTTN